MGRHSSPEQFPFYRSVVAWFLPWVLIAAVAGTAVWIAVDALGQDDLQTGAPVAQVTPSPDPSLSEEPEPSPSESPDDPEPSPTPSKEPEPKETKVELITEGVTVQVLNSTSDAGADDAMADRLARLGFDIVAIDGASTPYEVTTVFWSSDRWREAAEALAERFGWTAGPKPDNLSPTVSIHVVIGRDEV